MSQMGTHLVLRLQAPPSGLPPSGLGIRAGVYGGLSTPPPPCLAVSLSHTQTPSPRGPPPVSLYLSLTHTQTPSLPGVAGDVDLSVSTTGLPSNIAAPPATFRYEAPSPSVSPVDGSARGDTRVTVTAVGWGVASLLASVSSVGVEFGGVAGEVVSVISAESTSFYSRVTVVARTNPSPRLGVAA